MKDVGGLIVCFYCRLLWDGFTGLILLFGTECQLKLVVTNETLPSLPAYLRGFDELLSFGWHGPAISSLQRRRSRDVDKTSVAPKLCSSNKELR